MRFVYLFFSKGRDQLKWPSERKLRKKREMQLSKTIMLPFYSLDFEQEWADLKLLNEHIYLIPS